MRRGSYFNSHRNVASSSSANSWFRAATSFTSQRSSGLTNRRRPGLIAQHQVPTGSSIAPTGLVAVS